MSSTNVPNPVRNRKANDLCGQKFGTLLVLYEGEHKRFPCGKAYRSWVCRCDCGKTTTIRDAQLRPGKIQSCGCLTRSIISQRPGNHHLSRTRLYRIWTGMIGRCYNRKDFHYPRWGGRGIRVCEQWRHSPEMFVKDMGPSYKPGLLLDRRENNGDYCPENCRWATRTEQANNTRSNTTISHKGETLTISQWSRKLGINYDTLLSRLVKYGWSPEKALLTPVNKMCRHHS